MRVRRGAPRSGGAIQRSSTSLAALALAATALFVALGGTGWAGSLINGAQIKNGTITSAKIGAGQVKSVNLATGAVTATKVLPGSLTASDLARNTFLAASATAANSSELGGKAASAYVLGNSSVLFNRVAVTYGGNKRELLDVGIGEIDGICAGTGIPELSFTAEVTDPNLIEWSTDYPSTSEINTANGLAVGDTFTAPHGQTTIQAVTFQAAYNGGSSNHVATVWATGQSMSGGTCLFTAEALSTG